MIKDWLENVSWWAQHSSLTDFLACAGKLCPEGDSLSSWCPVPGLVPLRPGTHIGPGARSAAAEGPAREQRGDSIPTGGSRVLDGRTL